MKTVNSCNLPSEDEQTTQTDQNDKTSPQNKPNDYPNNQKTQIQKDLEDASPYKIDFGKELNRSLDQDLFQQEPPQIQENDIIKHNNSFLKNFFRLFWEDQTTLSYLCCSVSPNALMVIMLVFFLLRSSTFLIIFNFFYARTISPEIGIVLNTYAILFLLFPPFGSILFFGKVSGNISLNKILLCLDGAIGILLAVFLIIFVSFHLGRFLVPEGYSDFQIFADRVGVEPILVLGMLLPWLYHDLLFVSFFFLYENKKVNNERLTPCIIHC